MNSRPFSREAKHGATVALEGEPAVAAPTAVVGYDGSHGARRALAAAADAVGAGGRVFVVVATPPLDELEREDIGAQEDQLWRRLAEAAAYLDGSDVRVLARVVEADPVDALVAVARETSAQLIAVGARGESFLARSLRGSVGARLVVRAPCDLLVTR